MGTVDLGALADRTVGQVMLRAPKSMPADASVDAARAVLRDDHVHMVLLVDEERRLVATLVREDLSGAAGTAPARSVGRLEGRAVGPARIVRDVLPMLRGAVARRLAVVDDAGVLLGLLCLKRSRRGFCDDAGVAARAESRAGSRAAERLSPTR